MVGNAYGSLLHFCDTLFSKYSAMFFELVKTAVRFLAGIPSPWAPEVVMPS